MRRRNQHGGDVVGVERSADVDAARVDGDRDRLEPGMRDRLAVEAEAWVLDGDAAGAAHVAGRGRRSVRPCVNPPQTSSRSGAVATPRTRPR